MRRDDEKRAPELWVLELSSFQLEATSSLAPSAATMLNLSEDHLDRYRDMDEYAAAKARIFQGDGVQVLNRGDPRSLEMALPGRPVVTFGLDAPRRPEDYGLIDRSGEPWLARGSEALAAAKELKLPGRHNAANALAAIALCRAAGLPLPPLVSALRDFRGLPHRVEPVGEQGGVRYYDDSKGTNVGAAVAAISGLAHQHDKIVLIAGGEGKGQDFSPLREPLAHAGRAILLIGRDAPLIERALAGLRLEIRRAATMEEAVAAAAAQARPGDAVLLSPACASFDMFRNYAHRGEVFRAAVQRLPHGDPH
jgi:UDP-N-acetylmuramoylalanine--D-glutamate ligase